MENNIYSPLAVALDYIGRGYSPIPVEERSKKPVGKNWQNLKIKAPEAGNYFANNTCNIGVSLGSASNGLVDVDFDHPDALRFAEYYLPETNSVFGREGNPSSHWLYKVDNPKSVKQFKTEDHGTIIELRGNGGHTVFPGSVHVSGEIISFVRDGDPAETTWDDLEKGISKIALCAVFYGVWKKGNRHNQALALAGFMATHGFSVQEAVQIIQSIANEAGDEEFDDRTEAAETTYACFNQGKTISWRGDLETILGKSTVNSLERWFASKGSIAESNKTFQSYPDYSESGLSDAFADEYSEKLIWSGSEECWYQLRNKIYEKIDPVIVQGLGKSFLQELTRSRGNNSSTLLSRSRIDAVTTLSRNHLWKDPKIFNTNPELFGLDDGSILNLHCARKEISSDSIVTNKSGVVFDPNAECPIYIKFLNRIFENDQEIIQFLQRAIGYSLSGHVSEQKAFILIGKGANGKSTLLNIFQKLFGEYATTTPMQTLMEQGKFGNQTNDLAALKGKRFVVASEGERDQKLAVNKIKLMTGGDFIKARFMYGDYFEYKPKFKLWLATNNIPTIPESDDAIWRRLCIVEFPVSIPAAEQDPNLLKNLENELPGILNWALEGYRQWKDHGLQVPEKVLKTTKSFRDESDVVGQWLDSCCITSNNNATTPVKDLHSSYRKWCENSGHEALPANMFGKELTRKGFTDKRSNKGNKKIGISLIPSPDEDLMIDYPFASFFESSKENA